MIFRDSDDQISCNFVHTVMVNREPIVCRQSFLKEKFEITNPCGVRRLTSSPFKWLRCED